MSAIQILRLCITGAIAGLTAAMAYYPNQYWIPAVVGALGAIAVHVVPSVGQTNDWPNLHYPGIENKPDEPTNPLKGQ